MERVVRIGLLSLVAVLLVLIMIGEFNGYEEMSARIRRLAGQNRELIERTEGVIVDYGIEPNPFAPLFLLEILGLSIIMLLLIDEVQHRNSQKTASSCIT